MSRLPLLLAVLLLFGGKAQILSAPLEYQVKASFILNAARFVSWPQSAFNGPGDPLVIGVLGENPFGGTLEAIVQGETVQSRHIVVRSVRPDDAAQSCHVLFISRSERGRMGEVLRSVNSASVLTVSEIDQFARGGGILGLVVEAGKVRFEINADRAKNAGLKVDSRLLGLARIVK